MTILLTGANGFVGSAFLELALEKGLSLRAVCRDASRAPSGLPSGCLVIQPSMDAETDWQPALADITTVVHAAARVHVMNDNAADPLEAFRAVNVAGTLALAQQAARLGVRRFVFISSIKVNGEQTLPGQPFSALSRPQPQDDYGISKYEAELALRELEAASGMEVVIIRPVLVYGPGVKANFQTMMRWVRKGVPLPLGWTSNRRSLVSVYNLVDLMMVCTHHPEAAGGTFLVSDNDDMSTSQLLRRMAAALDAPARLIPVPPVLLATAAKLLGQGAVAQRLLGSLHVDIQTTMDQLGWVPPVSVDESLRRTARHFLSSR